MEMGKLIRQARKNAGLTQKELSDRDNVSECGTVGERPAKPQNWSAPQNCKCLWRSTRLFHPRSGANRVAGVDQNDGKKTHRRGRKRGRLRSEHQHKPRRHEHNKLAVEHGGSLPG